MESPPYRGASAPQQVAGSCSLLRDTTASCRPRPPHWMSLTTLKSRRWADEAAGRCSACRHRRSTSQGELPAPSGVGLSASRFDCSISAYNTYSMRRAGRVYPHEIDIQETHPKHRKLDSQAAIPHPTRDRAADGLRPKVWPLWGRDATMILVAYRHGLRASEVCGLQWRPQRAPNPG